MASNLAATVKAKGYKDLFAQSNVAGYVGSRGSFHVKRFAIDVANGLNFPQALFTRVKADYPAYFTNEALAEFKTVDPTALPAISVTATGTNPPGLTAPAIQATGTAASRRAQELENIRRQQAIAAATVEATEATSEAPEQRAARLSKEAYDANVRIYGLPDTTRYPGSGFPADAVTAADIEMAQATDAQGTTGDQRTATVMQAPPGAPLQTPPVIDTLNTIGTGVPVNPGIQADARGRAFRKVDRSGDEQVSVEERRAKHRKFDLLDLYHTKRGEDARDEDGKPKPPDRYLGYFLQDKTPIGTEDKLPEGYLTHSFFQAIDEMVGINGLPCYDAEFIALGQVSEKEYFLVPDSDEIVRCPASAVGEGIKKYRPEATFIAQVYAMAKLQAERLGVPDNQRIKWATLRMQAFIAGWWDRQKYSRFAACPNNGLDIWTTDLPEIAKVLADAWKLCALLPYIQEASFRAKGCVWSESNDGMYFQGAQTIAHSIGFDSTLGYMDRKHLFGDSFRWVGMSRVKEVLLAKMNHPSIPPSVKLRTSSAPAGAAVICGTKAVINAMSAGNYWAPFAEKGGYEDSIRKALIIADKITANPWKYHMMSYVYNEAPLTTDEKKEFDDAKLACKAAAPITQAYITVMCAGLEIANMQCLKRDAEQQGALYKKVCNFFTWISRQQVRSIEAAFLSYFEEEHVAHRKATRFQAQTGGRLQLEGDSSRRI